MKFFIEARFGGQVHDRYVVADTAEEALEKALRFDDVSYLIRSDGEPRDRNRPMVPTLGPKGGR